MSDLIRRPIAAVRALYTPGTELDARPLFQDLLRGEGGAQVGPGRAGCHLAF